jgi:hypothetical protein
VNIAHMTGAPDVVADEAAATPYRYDGPLHRIVSWPEVRAQRHAACGEAAAALVAAAWRHRMTGLVCLEEPAAVPTYAHLRVILDTPRGHRIYDPYADRRADVARSCEWIADLATIVAAASLHRPAASVVWRRPVDRSHAA